MMEINTEELEAPPPPLTVPKSKNQKIDFAPMELELESISDIE